MTYVLAFLAVSIVLIVYIFTKNSDVYADKININICKLLRIEISNKVKCPDKPNISSKSLKK
ncbi:MAG: hypothetical protein Q8942_13905 [Bacillota bacterium]|nr:hypothetical protein [Bacillota bacterium]